MLILVYASSLKTNETVPFSYFNFRLSLSNFFCCKSSIYFDNLSTASLTDVAFAISCVTTHSNQMAIADLQCIYNKDKADGNYDDFLTFNIEVDNINVDIRLTIEHPIF